MYVFFIIIYKIYQLNLYFEIACVRIDHKLHRPNRKNDNTPDIDKEIFLWNLEAGSTYLTKYEMPHSIQTSYFINNCIL